MKKAISLLLVLATLAGCCVGFLSCNGKKTIETPKLTYNADVIVDFNDTANIQKAGLTATTSNIKTAANAGSLNASAGSSTVLEFSNNDLTSYKELSVWINNTSSADMQVNFILVSENGSTSEEDSYSVTLNVHPGWHQYNIPFSQLIQDNVPLTDVTVTGTPLGISSLNSLKLVVTNGSGELLIDSVYAKTQKYGTIDGQQFTKLGNAVCFYEDSYAYLYDQLRYVLKEDDQSVGIKADDNTTYVPVDVLAEHRGATNISSTAEKVSFTYNGQNYEYTPDTQIDFVGNSLAFNPGKAMSVKPMVIADRIMIPMETCAEIFGYQLFYDQMGLVIFSDTADIYNSTNDYSTIYEIIETIAYSNYTGAELINDMNTLYPDNTHTRLMVNQEYFDNLKELIETDPVYAAWFKRFEAAYAKGTSAYNAALPKYELSDGYRLLEMSRDVMNRLLANAFLYKMTDNPDYADLCYRIMERTVRFTDPVTGANSWHPEHFLDTGELMFGVSIAYDWCYDYMTEEQRATIENGIWEVGYGAALGFGQLYEWWGTEAIKIVDGKEVTYNPNLEAYNQKLVEQGLPEYDGYSINRNGAPYHMDEYNESGYYNTFNFNRNNWSNNWNAVCNGGMVMMALAFANVSSGFREASEYLLDCCLYTIPAGLEEGYATDGGYPEGPGYWSYGTTYSVVFMSALKASTGSDYGFTNAPGFRESFYFINSLGSIEKGAWNYHDAGEGRIDSGLYFWFASNTGDKNIGGLRYNSIMEGFNLPGYWDMIWYAPDIYTTDIDLSLDAAYYGIDTVTFRSDWTKNALFCGLHGGANDASHGNLDIGNFILEYGGTRFFIDLGSDEYNLKHDDYREGKVVIYFSTPYRYWLYRERAEGQNTLVIDPTRVNISITNSGSDSVQGKNYDQLYSAVSELTRFESSEDSALAVVDMGCAYREALNGVRGMLVTDDRSTVIIQDEITFNDNSAHTVYWMGHVGYTTVNGQRVSAEITISEDRKSAVIELEGKSLLCTIVVPEGYESDFYFEVQSANYLPETGLTNGRNEYSREGIQKLVAKSTNCTGEIKLAIVCRLLSDGPYDYTWTDIADWTVE